MGHGEQPNGDVFLLSSVDRRSLQGSSMNYVFSFHFAFCVAGQGEGDVVLVVTIPGNLSR